MKGNALREPQEGVHREPVVESRRFTSEQLLGPATQVVIEHAGQEYRLCKTRNGKLILVK